MSGKCGLVGKTLTAQRRSWNRREQLGFERHRAQQEGRQMRRVAVVHGRAHGLRGAARSRVFDARDRGWLLLLRLRPALRLLGSPLMLVPSALRRARRLPWFVSWFVSWLASWLVLWLGRRAGDLVHEGDWLADQLFDRGDGLGVV